MTAGRASTLVATLAAALLLAAFDDAAAATAATRITVFGDSAATAVAYDPEARRILGRGIDLRLEVAACRRLGDLSCPSTASDRRTSSTGRRRSAPSWAVSSS